MGIKDFFKVAVDDKTIKELGEVKELRDFSGLNIAIDAAPIIHAAVRGMPHIDTMTHNGKITSHINVIFFNVVNFHRLGIKQMWVFDGGPPTIKTDTLDKRREAREKANTEIAKSNDNVRIEKLKKRGYQLEEYIIKDVQRLLTYMGIPWTVAPEEAEAYCAKLNKDGDYDYVLSPDSDCLMFGAKRLIRPTKEGRNKVYYVYIRKHLLKTMGIDQTQLIKLGLCLGTDFSAKIAGVGPKTVLRKVLNDLLHFDKSQKKALRYFKEFQTDGAETHEPVYNREKLEAFLTKRNFKLERLSKHIDALEE